jgi:trehalose synthase
MNGPFIRQTPAFDLPGFEPIVGTEAIVSLRSLASEVKQAFHRDDRAVTVLHINSSSAGGGVADILNYLVPLSNEVGIAAKWLVIAGDDSFFEITKKFHNALQGSLHARITPRMFSHYECALQQTTYHLRALFREHGLSSPDIIVVHDPQPAGLIPYFRQQFPESLVIWRGHIQFDLARARASDPGCTVWRYLLGYVNQCDAAIFHLPEMAPPGLRIPARYILPSINPLAFINRDLSRPEAREFIDSTLRKYGLEHFHDRALPLLLQNARFDPWKDPTGVIRAVRSARKLLPRQTYLPQLVLAGPLAQDDPEAQAVLGQLRQMLDGDGAVHLLPIDPKSKFVTPDQKQALCSLGLEHTALTSEDLMELELNALQTRADIIIAKSLREGFGLAVTGAGYHGKPRIVSQVGGLVRQVEDGNGNLLAAMVGGRPHFNREASIKMTRDWIFKLLTTPELCEAMGRSARKSVIQNFLPHRHLSDYFNLFLDLQKGRAFSSTHRRSNRVRNMPSDPESSVT